MAAPVAVRRPSRAEVDGRVADLALAGATIVLGVLFRFTQDDAYITLSYAEHLANGTGLVFNPGEPVEGYTTFLWTVLLSVPFRLGVDPVWFAAACSIGAGVATVLVTRRLVSEVLGRQDLGVFAAVALLCFHTFLIYLTGGMETQLQTALLVGTALLLVRWRADPGTVVPLAAASLLAGLALLTRLDSAVILVALGVPAVLAVRHVRSLTLRMVVAALVPVLVLLVPWFVWKGATYGSYLPNTLAAKSIGLGTAFGRGVAYIVLFLILTGLVFLIPMVMARREILEGPTRSYLAVPALWALYLLFVGGDFMDFRFMVPVLPYLVLLLAGALVGVPRARWVAVLAVLLVASTLKFVFFESIFGVESARALSAHLPTWELAGETLGDEFPPGAPVRPTVALTPAGVAPFVSELRTIDMLGLNDPGAIANSWPALNKPGHDHIATVDHLIERGTDLVLGGIVVQPCGLVDESRALADAQAVFWDLPLRRDDFPSDARVVEIPLDRAPGRCLIAVDISGDPGWRAEVERRGWTSTAIPG